jgi:hypothetical protein
MGMQVFERAWKKVLLSVAESFLPRGYFVQGEPVYMTGEMVATEQLVPGYPKETQRFNQSLHGNIYAPMRDTNRWLLLRLMLNQVSSLPTGDYAELGTYQGASARIIYAHRAPETKRYCFDTFQGFSEKDIAIERTESGVMATTGDFANTSLNEVESFIGGKR